MNNERFKTFFKVVNPAVLILYGIGCKYLVDLAQYGGVQRRLPFIIMIFIILFLWFLYMFIKIKNQSFAGYVYPYEKKMTPKEKLVKGWFFVASSLLLLISLQSAYNIYQSAIPFNGKLSWYINRYKTQKETVFEHNNVFTHGLTGMLKDINETVTLPDTLFVSDYFTLTYKSTGEITNLYGILYGKNARDEQESFLISYDATKSDSIEITLDGYIEATYDEFNLFQPLVDALKIINLESYNNVLQSDEISLYYEGVRTLIGASDSIHYFNKDGMSSFIGYGQDEHMGYSFTLETSNNRMHFIQYDEEMIIEQIKQREEQVEPEADSNYFNEDEISEESFLNEDTGFQLIILDAATGSRFYGLRKTVDGGLNWTMYNANPFLDSFGISAGLMFIDENLGFAALAKNGGTYAELFRTTDGGLTFEKVELPSVTVVQLGQEYQPFDFPEMPYVEENKLILKVGQGSDGDYNMGAKAIFTSNNDGASFEFIREE